MTDIATITFVLRGVTLQDEDEEKQMPRFVAKGKSQKRHNLKVQTRTDYSGHRIHIAYTGDVKFSGKDQNADCFWCHHPYDTPFICIPIKWEQVGTKYRFQGPGSFCSMFCLRAHLRSLEMYKKPYQPEWLERALQLTNMAFSMMYPPDVKLKPAPDWALLENYNGHMSIQEFRKTNCDKTYILTPNVQFEPAEQTFLIQ